MSASKCCLTGRLRHCVQDRTGLQVAIEVGYTWTEDQAASFRDVVKESLLIASIHKVHRGDAHYSIALQAVEIDMAVSDVIIYLLLFELHAHRPQPVIRAMVVRLAGGIPEESEIKIDYA